MPRQPVHKNKKKTADVRESVPVIYAGPDEGLTAAQAAERMEKGYGNFAVEPPSKTVAQIVLSNVFTYFNLVFMFLAACVIAVRSWYNLTFLPVVIANTLIGIFQELRSKRTLDKLSLLSAPKGKAVRDGALRDMDVTELVRDDVVVFAAGDQIYADAVVIAGECQANEALITGEVDEIKKTAGVQLLSGSFIVSGRCQARLTAVGADSYVSRLTLEAKKAKKSKPSEMMRSLSQLIKWIGLILLPFGVGLFIKEYSWLQRSVQDGVVSTVAALIGMIPEGLYFLTSIALTTGVVRLAKRRTLVHELSCIETLARVDTLCVDKTGTITENKMIVEDVVPLCPERFIVDDIRMIMADYVFAMQNDNDTMAALKRYFTGTVNQQAVKTLPFTSRKKYGGVSFHEDETYILGAPEVIAGPGCGGYAELVEQYSAQGCRVLMLALYDGDLDDEKLAAGLMPLALILLANKIRREAPDTFRFFAKQGVTVKVISGDNPVTVSEVAKRAGIENAEKYVDARKLDDKSLRRAAEEYTVFGRVTPEQKRKLVRALKAAGHTVAMTGDGVNDVLALKEADCSVAMASGSDVAARVSHIVLLNSNFAAMPSVVMEGRRVTNNIERSASLFLVKNIFSFALALISLFFTLPYPFSPSQMSLVNMLTIGIPSYVLALEPNEERIKGKFLKNVIYRALPAALTDLVLILGVLLFYIAFGFEEEVLSTICTVVMGVVGLLMVNRTCKPYNKLEKILMAGLAVGFVFCVLFMKTLFTLTPLDFSGWLVLVVVALLAYPVMAVMDKLVESIAAFITRKKRAPRHAA